MHSLGRTMVCGAAALVLTTGTALAGHLHHRYRVSHHRSFVAPYSDPAYGYASPSPAGWISSAEIVRQATARAYLEPGTTLELAPDAKETATGGPVGGVPGFDGT